MLVLASLLLPLCMLSKKRYHGCSMDMCKSKHLDTHSQTNKRANARK